MRKSIIPCSLGVFLLVSPVFLSAQSTSTCPNLTRNLSYGARGTDVMSLQTFLISKNILAAGNNTGYFGIRTQAAVQTFQKSNVIVTSGTPATTGYGAVGPKTRGAMNQVCRGLDGVQMTSPVATSTNGTHTPLIINFEFGAPFPLVAGQTGVDTGGFWGVQLDSINDAMGTADVAVTPCMGGFSQNIYTGETFTVTLNQPHPFGYFGVAKSSRDTSYYVGTVTLSSLTANSATFILGEDGPASNATATAPLPSPAQDSNVP
jgi:peptidoglycan hydrolase-like protein with peptidoglycan-binding domain